MSNQNFYPFTAVIEEYLHGNTNTALDAVLTALTPQTLNNNELYNATIEVDVPILTLPASVQGLLEDGKLTLDTMDINET
ncbi:MAG: hypothetical protein ACI8ZF_000380 [Candidatus Midichloriaceae bacterium]|jgi:hypothetical protein